MPFFWTPWTKDAPILPARKGSSEKYSKFLPQRGLRLILTPGPRTVLTFSAFASSAIAEPTSSMRSVSHDDAVVTAGGKQVAVSAGFITFVPAFCFSLRIP